MSDDDLRDVTRMELASAVQRMEWLCKRLDDNATTSSDIRDAVALRLVLETLALRATLLATRHE